MQAQWACGPKMEHKRKTKTPQLDTYVLQIMPESTVIFSVALLPQEKRSMTLNMWTVEKLIMLLFITYNSQIFSWPRTCEGVKDRVG